MNATERRTVEERLVALLETEERSTAPHDALESVRSRVAATGQRSGPIVWRGPMIRARSTSRMAMLGMAAVLVAIGAALVTVGSRQTDQFSLRPTPAPSRVASGGFEIGPTIDLGIVPRSVAAGMGAIWVAGMTDNYNTEGHLLRVDATTHAVTRLPTAFSQCNWGSNEWDWPKIVIAAGSLWMPDCGPHEMLRVNPRTGAIEARFPSAAVTSARPGNLITFDASSAWLVRNATTGEIVRLDTTTNKATPFVTLGTDVTAIEVDGASLWAAGPTSIVHIDLATRKVAATPLDGTIDRMTVVDHEAWTWLGSDHEGPRTLVVVDPAGATSTSIIAGVRTVNDIVLHDGLLWIVSDRFTLVAVDVASRTVVATLPVDNAEGGLAPDGDTVWVGLAFEKQLLEVARQR
ncbi:MAG TPA: hypothetical protein VKA85_00960 [Candidatus Limnocylindrales bacterium]|nr:hypothetical protein [Candidatus Limnocylindrales bacterium]